MHIRFGETYERNGEPRPVVWSTEEAVNGHLFIVGTSGAGKTHRIRGILDQMIRHNSVSRIYVIDSHGDMGVRGESVVKFSETAGFGLNPLAIDPDPEFGGVRKRINSFIRTLERTTTRLGDLQRACLFNLMNDMYAWHGFYMDNPNSWRIDVDLRRNPRFPKRQPTLADLARFADKKLEALYTGMAVTNGGNGKNGGNAGSRAIAALDALNKEVRKLDRKQQESIGREDVNLDGLKAACIDAYANYVNQIETGRELSDVIKYDSRETLRGVCSRIHNLMRTGIFQDALPPFDPDAAVWRFDIRSLPMEERQMFTDLIAEMIFLGAKQRGTVSAPDTFLVIDEAHAFVDRKDDEHVLNLIVKEGRKFGLGLMMASQSLSHFSDDMISNVACKLVLGVDELFQRSTAAKMNVDPRRLAALRLQRTALVQIKSPKSDHTGYVEVRLAA